MTSATDNETTSDRDITNAIAGHKMAGFDITHEHRKMLQSIADGTLTADEVVAEVRANNDQQHAR